MRKAIVAASLFVLGATGLASLREATASGLAAARFGGEHGHVTAANATALYHNPAGIAYDYGVTTPGRVTAIVATLAAGQSGTLTFQVNVASGVAPGDIANSATCSGRKQNPRRAAARVLP